MLYLGKKSTGFRLSQMKEAEAAAESAKLADYAAAVGRIAPSAVTLDEICDFYKKRRKPVYGATAAEIQSYRKKGDKLERVRKSFPGRHLFDINHESCDEYVDIRSEMPGRNKLPDGTRQRVSDQTIRGELMVLREAVRFYCKQLNLQYMPHIRMPAKGRPRLAWLDKGEMVRYLRAARGWLWDEAADRFQTITVFDPAGVDMVWDEAGKTFKLERLGRPGMVTRPYVDRARLREWRGIRRMLVLGYRTGTRHMPLLRMRWKTDGLAGFVDFAPFGAKRLTCLHRVGLKNPDSTKGQKPIIAPRKLTALMRAWHARDLRECCTHVVHADDGSSYIGYVGDAFREIAVAAGMHPMKVDADDRRFVVRDEDALHGARLLPNAGRDTPPPPATIDLIFHVISRHTCAVWGLQRGASATEMAAFLSCSQAVFEGVYGHWTILGTRSARDALDDHEDNAARRAMYAEKRRAAGLDPERPAPAAAQVAPSAEQNDALASGGNVISWPFGNRARLRAT